MCRGSVLVSRLATYYRDDARFLAFAFLAVSYLPPAPDDDIHKTNAMTKEMLGYEVLGYQLFFAEESTGQIIKEHVSAVIPSP